MMDLKRFFIIFLLYSAGISVLTILFSRFAPENLVSEVYMYMVPFFFVVVIISRLVFSSIVRKNRRQFSNAFLGITGFRFILYLAALVSYSVIFPQDASQFIVLFFVNYFLFTVLEVYLLYKELRHGSAG